MKRKRFVAVPFLLLLLPGGPASGADRDPKAETVGRELIAAMGGEKAWEKARVFQFHFLVEQAGKPVADFAHAWDRYTGDYRLTGADKAGAPFAVFFNVNTKEGTVFVNGRAVEGEERANRIQGAYERFINDTYWLLAPWKIFDPGVNLAYDGEKAGADGALCDVLRLSFDNVGLTPKDIYWLYVARDGRRMVQWQYVLGGAQQEPTTALWKNWQSFGGILLSLEKPMVGRPATIRFEQVSVSPSREDTLFTPKP